MFFSATTCSRRASARRGLPIGNLTSQFFANLYLDGFDHFVTEVLRAPYVRYVDEFALFHDDPAVLVGLARPDRTLSGGAAPKLHPRQDLYLFCRPRSRPPPSSASCWMPQAGRRLPEANVARFRNRLRGLRDRWRAGTVATARRGGKKQRLTPGSPMRSTRTRGGCAGRCSRAGGLSRASTPEAWTAPCRRVASRRLPGTTHPRERSAPPPATGTPPTTGTTISALRVGQHAFRQSRRDHGFAGRALKRPGPFMMSDGCGFHDVGVGAHDHSGACPGRRMGSGRRRWQRAPRGVNPPRIRWRR